MVMYFFKIFRLVIIVFMITYFVGCIWWLSVTNLNSDLADKTYVSFFEMDKLYVKSGMDGKCGLPECEDLENHIVHDDIRDHEFVPHDQSKTPVEEIPDEAADPFASESTPDTEPSSESTVSEPATPPQSPATEGGRRLETDQAKIKCVGHKWKQSNCEKDVITLVVIQCYFALTTLSTIGYGDLYPVSVPEMFVGIVFMLVGIVFFS